MNIEDFKLKLEKKKKIVDNYKLDSYKSLLSVLNEFPDTNSENVRTIFKNKVKSLNGKKKYNKEIIKILDVYKKPMKSDHKKPIEEDEEEYYDTEESK